LRKVVDNVDRLVMTFHRFPGFFFFFFSLLVPLHFVVFQDPNLPAAMRIEITSLASQNCAKATRATWVEGLRGKQVEDDDS